jgi:hypothetical protein
MLAILALLASVAMVLDNNWLGAAFGCVLAVWLFAMVICGVSDSSSFVMTGRLAYPQRHGGALPGVINAVLGVKSSGVNTGILIGAAISAVLYPFIGMLSQKFGRRPTITVIGLLNLIRPGAVLRPCRFRHYEQNAKDCIREAKGTDDPQRRKQLLKWARE